MKIAVYSIAKNEAKFAARWAHSCRAADYRVVLDTGSSDETIKRLTDCGVMVSQASFAPFRFDDARNAALSLIPLRADVCIALDMDETLEPGWRFELEAGWHEPQAFDTGHSAFISFNFNGEIFAQNNRVHSRQGWRWKHPCHEALMPSMNVVKPPYEIPGVEIVHRPDLSKPRPNYLEMLAWGQFEDPANLRMLYYYGRELMFTGHYRDALERFDQYTTLYKGEFPAEYEAVAAARAQCAANL